MRFCEVPAPEDITEIVYFPQTFSTTVTMPGGGGGWGGVILSISHNIKTRVVFPPALAIAELIYHTNIKV